MIKPDEEKAGANPALEAARSFMRCWQQGGRPDLNIIDRLGRQALSPEPAEAAPATRALYSVIIEGLCDDFSSAGVELCNLVLLRLLEVVRKTAPGRQTDRLLQSLNLGEPQQLLERYQRLNRRSAPLNTVAGKVKKIIILSRVTVGADVEITSVMARRLLNYFVRAKLVIIGPRHISEIFYNLDRVSYLSFNYVRQGSLAERLTFWPALYDLVQEQGRGLAADEILLFDPDSRLSQRL